MKNQPYLLIAASFWIISAPVLAAPKPVASKLTTVKPFAETLPSEMQIKFQWTAATSIVPGSMPEGGAEVLTLVAKEGQLASLVSKHTKNGDGAKRTITVLPSVNADGTIEMYIGEESETTVGGETRSTSCTTTVRLKDGQTGLVHGSTGKEGAQGQENVLFVTPSLLHSTP